jgi:hypothetical protein
MPTIRVRGIKSYRSKGQLYHYHRTTGIRIEIDIEASPERFLARVRELDAAAAQYLNPRPKCRWCGPSVASSMPGDSQKSGAT